MQGSQELVSIYILIPVFNDWPAVSALLRVIDETVAPSLRTHIFLIDDGSTLPLPENLLGRPTRISSVEVLHLKRNLGHQRALCTGMVYLQAHRRAPAVVVMDGDGEDAPSDIELLLQTAGRESHAKIVFAARTKRAEGLVFQIFYRLFQAFHQLLIGFGTNMGNFSVIPFALLDRLVVVPELWNHYAASVVKAKLPYVTVPVARTKRLDGRSRMGFVGLVIHGLSAISVFSDIVAARLLVCAFAVTALAAAGIVGVVFIRFATSLAIPGWATSTAGLLLLLLLQCLLLAMIFAFNVMQGRSSPIFIPARDCPYFWGDVRMLYEADQRASADAS